MTKIKYTVHSVQHSTVARKVTVGGVDVDAQVPAFVAECVSEDGGMGHTFSFIGGDAASAAELFETGAAVTATFKREAD